MSPERVSIALWRSAQPADSDWAAIKALGITTIVKLNTDAEGSDAGAEAIGLRVVRCPIEPIADGNLLHEAAAIFEKPDPQHVATALATMTSGEKVLVHCSHGVDRTSLLVGLYRVKFGWTKKAAWDEMLAHGFHPEFLGLDWALWESQ